MKKDYFKPEDFYKVINHNLTLSKDPAGQYASIANVLYVVNEKLNKLIESWPVVWSDNAHSWFENENPISAKKARLAFIEEIKKDCKHEPFNDSCVPNHFHCKHCGVELQATWSEKK